MANSVLHIKDGYFFEVPKMLWRVNYRSLDEGAGLFAESAPA
jgi:hypothetical protein